MWLEGGGFNLAGIDGVSGNLPKFYEKCGDGAKIYQKISEYRTFFFLFVTMIVLY